MNARVLIGAGMLCIGALSAGSASAATFTVTQPGTLPSSTSAGLAPTEFAPTVLIDVVGNQFDGNNNLIARSPYDGITTGPVRVDNGRYHSVQANATARYTFGTDQFFLSLIWGSPDTYNQIRFFDGSGATIGSVITASTAGLNTSGLGFANVKIENIGGQGGGFRGFDLFSVGANAFEFSQVVTPIPAAGLLLLSGLLGLGWLRRRNAASDTSERVGSLSAA
jgi:hypothetical protein